MNKKQWNLFAAIFCTLGAAFCGVAALIGKASLVNVIVAVGCGLGVIGGGG